MDDQRFNHIINKINFYGYCGDRVKGLLFCSDKKEAKELEMIRCVINYKADLIFRLKHILKEQYDITFKDSTEISIVNVITNKFTSGSGKATYKECIFLEKYNLDYKSSEIFIENLKNEEFKRILVELIEFGIDITDFIVTVI